MRTCQPKSRPLVKETDVAKRVRTSPPWLERNSFTIISLLREETLPEIHYTSPRKVIILQFILANLGPILILRKCECEYEQDEEGKRIVTIKMRSGCPHKDCIDRALCQLQVSCQVATKVFHLKFGFPFNCISWSKYDILQDTGWAGGAWQGEEKTTLSYLQSPMSRFCETHPAIREWFSEMKSTALIAGVWERPWKDLWGKIPKHRKGLDP